MWKQAPTAYPWLVELGSTALENTALPGSAVASKPARIPTPVPACTRGGADGMLSVKADGGTRQEGPCHPEPARPLDPPACPSRHGWRLWAMPCSEMAPAWPMT